MADDFKELEQKMKKAVEAAIHDYHTIRTGRANPMLLDNIKVDYYGNPTPLNQIAGIAAPEPRMIVVTPWDKTAIDAILKAIQSSELGMNPMSDGNVVRINIPPLTEERRKELIKLLHKKAEDHRVSVRNIRRDANDKIKQQEKNGEITEDDMKRDQDEVQKITDKYIADIDKLTESKEEELMEV